MSLAAARQESTGFSAVRTVLIVDDEDDIRDALGDIVGGLGLPVITAVDAEDARRQFTAHSSSINLVITDLKMDARGADDIANSAGSRLIDWLGGRAPACPIIVYTAFEMSSKMAELVQRSNVAAYLRKTNDPKAIERDVLAALPDTTLGVKGRGDWQAVTAARAPLWQVATPLATIAGSDHRMTISGALELTLGEIRWRRVTTQQGDYIEFDGRGLRNLAAPRTPALPVLTQRVALPAPIFDLHATLRTNETDWIEIDPGSSWVGILPVAEPWVEGESPRYVLAAGATEAGERLVITPESSPLDGVHCATLAVRPFDYDPHTRRLRVLTRARVLIKGQQGAGLAAPLPAPDPLSPLTHQMVGWPATTAAGDTAQRLDQPTGRRPTAVDSGGDVPKLRYLVVGTEAAVAALEPLLEWHRTDLEVLPPLLLGGAGLNIPPGAAHKEIAGLIRAELERRWQSSTRLHFVLLAGGGNTIPFFLYKDGYRTDHDEVKDIPILSDLWYALFDRDLPTSSPRFALGRLPFDDPAQLRAYAERCVKMGRDGTWRHWLFGCGQDKWSQENLTNVFQQADVSEHPLLRDRVDGPALNEPISADRMSQLLAAGPTLTTFRGHGARHCWYLYCPIATDPRPAVQWPPPDLRLAPLPTGHGVLSVACCTANLDDPGGGELRRGCGICKSRNDCATGLPLGVRALAEGRTLWFLGSSRQSFSKVNDFVHQTFMGEVCAEDGAGLRIGDVHRRVLDKVAAEATSLDPFSTSEWTDTAAMSILLGDPAAPLCPWPVEQTTDALAATAIP